MKYCSPMQFDPRALMDNNQTFALALNRNRTILASLGTAILVFYRKGHHEFDANAKLSLSQPCYCNLDEKGQVSFQPDKGHQLCFGSGYLPGYERWGMETTILATTFENMTLTNVEKGSDSKNRVSKFTISGNNKQGIIETGEIPLTTFKEISFFRFTEKTNREQNKNEYYFSPAINGLTVADMLDTTNTVDVDQTVLDNLVIGDTVVIDGQELGEVTDIAAPTITTKNSATGTILAGADVAIWTEIPIDFDDLKKPVVDLSIFATKLDETSTKIKFRVVLRKRDISFPSPLFIYFRFRYRKFHLFKEIDRRFLNIDVPALLAAFTMAPYILTQEQRGMMLDHQPTYWTLPDSRIQNGDLVVFLTGTNQGKMFEAKGVTENIYGAQGTPLSIRFETHLIKESNDVLGVAKLLLDDDEVRSHPLFSHLSLEAILNSSPPTPTT